MRRALVAAIGAVALVLPAAAWAHAALVRTIPAASVTVSAPPKEIRLVYSEAVEPRFAIVSVTDAAGRQQTAGTPRRSPRSPDELLVPLHRLRAGWYLVFWRVISDDGHPARGAFTFAVGPHPGAAPRFAIPSLSETAATPRLVVARWIVLLALLSAVGLFVFRIRTAFWTALAVALVATPIYALLATAQFALRSIWSIGALAPLMRVSPFGRGYLVLELLLALFAVAAAMDFRRRSLLSTSGALLAAGAALLVPGTAGHAAQTSPRPLALAFDWIHLAAAAVWIGGLIGLLVHRGAGLQRFSKIALLSVLALLGAGIGASVLHLPTLASLWQTSYGVAILVKAGLLLAAVLLAALNLFRMRLALVAVEAVLVAATVSAAAVLSSLPPPRALASVGHVNAHAGPGPVRRLVEHGSYRLELRVTPNRAAVPDDVAVRIARNGAPVRGASVVVTLTMLDMEMPAQQYRLPERAPGLYERDALPALAMAGHWGIAFAVRPPGAKPFAVTVVDRAR